MTAWILLLNGLVGYQLLDDGTPVSLGLLFASGGILFVGTAYISLDTGFSWTGHFDPSHDGPDNRNIGLYVLYLLFPLICLVGFLALESILVLRILGELRPMSMRRLSPRSPLTIANELTVYCPLVYLGSAALLFAIGQIFQYVISTHLCQASSGAINGALFETLFTLLAVGGVWIFWSSITEDDWPTSVGPLPDSSRYD